MFLLLLEKAEAPLMLVSRAARSFRDLRLALLAPRQGLARSISPATRPVVS
ncbi:MAG: hypothetical protein ACR2GK_03885 [Gemmatimonadaceae bacterium]